LTGSPKPSPLARLIATAVIAAAVVTAWLHWRQGPGVSATRKPAAAVPLGASGAAVRGNPNPPGPPVSAAVVDAPSELAEGLNSPASDIHADLRQVNDIFMHYRSATRGDNPVGDNADITAVLTGRNKLGFAFIPKDCPAINPQGELCDRWGTPFFFHQISGQEMEIRSAGPDRKLWTADDEVLTP
jgi:hypothetical protein